MRLTAISGRSLFLLLFPGANLIFGVFLLVWTLANVVTLILARRISLVLSATFLAASLTFLFFSIGEFSNQYNLIVVSGWLGLITAVLAWYIVLALLLAEAKRPFRPPPGARN